MTRVLKSNAFLKEKLNISPITKERLGKIGSLLNIDEIDEYYLDSFVDECLAAKADVFNKANGECFLITYDYCLVCATDDGLIESERSSKNASAYKYTLTLCGIGVRETQLNATEEKWINEFVNRIGVDINDKQNYNDGAYMVNSNRYPHDNFVYLPITNADAIVKNIHINHCAPNFNNSYHSKDGKLKADISFDINDNDQVIMCAEIHTLDNEPIGISDEYKESARFLLGTSFTKMMGSIITDIINLLG